MIGHLFTHYFLTDGIRFTTDGFRYTAVVGESRRLGLPATGIRGFPNQEAGWESFPWDGPLVIPALP